MIRIQLEEDTKDMIGSFGSRKESYDSIIRRIYKLAVKERLRKFYNSSEDYITIEEAKALNKSRFPKQKLG